MRCGVTIEGQPSEDEMSQTTPGLPAPGPAPETDGPPTPGGETAPIDYGSAGSAGSTTSPGSTDFSSPTPPPPPPPTWYGETAPLPTTPPLATTPGPPTTTPPGGPFGGGPQPEPTPRRPRRWVDIVVAAVVAAAVAGGTAGIVVHNSDDNNGATSANSSSSSSSNAPAPVQQASGTAPDWAVTAAAVEPSVVAITVGSTQSGQEAQGSGIILDKSGHVLTNNHVATAVAGGPITVTLTDQRTYKATIVGTDPTTDLAVLKIANPPADLKPASLGDSGKLAVGQPVMAVGNPLGLADTVTTGIVSALNRPVTTAASDGQGADSGGNDSVITNAIQTDAAINPGNSGGALVTASGQVIGINSSIASLSGGDAFGGTSQSGSIGLGFAIPINEAKTISTQIIATGTVQHPFLGVSLEDGNVAQGSAQRAAAVVQSVTAGTPAASAGLRKGDAVIAIDNDPVNGALSLTAEVRERAVGDKVTLTVIRDGKQITVPVTMAARPAGG
jgi:putative serine protease PepD